MLRPGLHEFLATRKICSEPPFSSHLTLGDDNPLIQVTQKIIDERHTFVQKVLRREILDQSGLTNTDQKRRTVLSEQWIRTMPEGMQTLMGAFTRQETDYSCLSPDVWECLKPIVLESIQDAVEYGVPHTPIELKTNVSESELVVTIKNEMSKEHAVAQEIRLSRLRTLADVFAALHEKLDDAPDSTAALKADNQLTKLVNEHLRRVHPDLQGKGVDPKFIQQYGCLYRGNGSCLIAINRINQVWMDIHDTTYTKTIFLEKNRYDAMWNILMG